MIEQDLVTFLTTRPALTAIQDTRVYPDRLPQSPPLPAMVFFSISDPASYTHDGETLKEERFQFDCWAKDPLTAIRQKNELRNACSGFKGMMGDTYIEAAFFENSRTLDDDETGLYRRIAEIVFHYK